MDNREKAVDYFNSLFCIWPKERVAVLGTATLGSIIIRRSGAKVAPLSY